jgi:UDP-N-acetylmuramate--alanine ligase
MKLTDIHIVYFIGVGGIGMSALARWFKFLGKEVYGYDRTSTPLTEKLIDEGIEIHFEDNVALIPHQVLSKPDETLVVFTPAIPIDHLEFNFLKDKGLRIMKRSEVLGLITEELNTVAVAGTHGKTTTSSMIAHILASTNTNSVAFMGGILQGYESNLIISGEEAGDSIAIVEADEFDRSFLKLYPNVAVITSADPDHLDIYGDHDSLKFSFANFIENIRKNGALVISEQIARDFDLSGLSHEITYGIDAGKCFASNIRVENGSFYFNFHGLGVHIKDTKIQMPGFHNIENAVAAIAVCLILKLTPEQIREGLESYQGVKRRFEYRIRRDDLVYIDDYAHHPSEISALLESVKALYPNRKITAVFQPHLFTRTRDFAEGFASSLDLADEVILLEIYPARELPIAGITSEIILNNMATEEKRICKDDELLSLLANREIDVLLTIGAGDIDRFVLPIQEMLAKG